MVMAMRGMNSVAAASSASSRCNSHSQTKSEHFILRMRAFSLSVSCGSGFAATGLGSAPVDGRSSTFISMLLSTGLPVASMAGRKRALCRTLTSCGSNALSAVFSVTSNVAHSPVVADAHRGDHLAGEFRRADVDLGGGGGGDDLWLAGSGLRQEPRREGQARLIENTARAVENMCELTPFLQKCRHPPVGGCRQRLAVRLQTWGLLEAAGCAQRPLRVHESESGVEIEPVGIIDALRPDVAPEVAQFHVVRRQPQGPINQIGRQLPWAR